MTEALSGISLNSVTFMNKNGLVIVAKLANENASDTPLHSSSKEKLAKSRARSK
ncbi:MAG: hypothetical protein AAF636_26850 [Pseudomonadota bacterium]